MKVLIAASLIASSTLLFATSQISGPPSDASFRLAMTGKKWMRSDDVDKKDGHKTAMFTIFAAAAGSPSGEMPPHATLMCGKMGVFPVIDGGPLKDGAVKITFDNGSALNQTWKWNGKHWFASQADNAAILKGWATAKSFKFEFNPVNKPAQAATFNMADYQTSVLKEPLCKR